MLGQYQPREQRKSSILLQKIKKSYKNPVLKEFSCRMLNKFNSGFFIMKNTTKNYTVEELFSPCVYLLLQNKKVVYVGQSKIGLKRASFHYGEKDFDEIKIIPCNIEMLEEVESELILEHIPIYNKTIGSYKSIASIKKILKDEYGMNISKVHIKNVLNQMDVEIKHFQFNLYISKTKFAEVVDLIVNTKIK